MILTRNIMKNIKQRFTKGVIGAFVGLALTAVGSIAHANDSWPEHSITIVVPYPAGGAADHSGRAIARGLEKELGQTVLRSEEHTSELQSRGHLVCRLLLEKKNNKYSMKINSVRRRTS